MIFLTLVALNWWAAIETIQIPLSLCHSEDALCIQISECGAIYS